MKKKLTAMWSIFKDKNEYNAFVWVVLGCFGIAGVEKFAKK